MGKNKQLLRWIYNHVFLPFIITSSFENIKFYAASVGGAYTAEPPSSRLLLNLTLTEISIKITFSSEKMIFYWIQHEENCHLLSYTWIPIMYTIHKWQVKWSKMKIRQSFDSLPQTEIYLLRKTKYNGFFMIQVIVMSSHTDTYKVIMILSWF